MVTEGGTSAKAPFELSFTTTGEAQFAFNRTTPTELRPPTTDEGLKARLAKAAGVTVTVTVLLSVPSLAVIVTAVLAETALVITGNWADELWGAKVNDEG